MQNQPVFEVYSKQVRSKIIHGSVLQSEGKQLVLCLKSVNPSYSEAINEKQRTLRKIQLSLFRIFQNKKQGKLLAKECIQYPKNGSVYEIQFEDIDSIKGMKPKAIANMVFQIIPSIEEELDNASYDSERNSEQDQIQDQSQISEHLQGIQQTDNNLHFTLGVNKDQLSGNKNQRQRKDENIFNDDSELSQENLKNQKQELIIVSKLNDLSKMIDENLQKSKKENAEYKNYVNQTSLMIQNWKDSEIQSNFNQNKLNSKKNKVQPHPSQGTQENAHKSPKQPKTTSNIKSQATTVPKSSQNKLQYNREQNSEQNQNDLSLLLQQRFQYPQQLSGRNQKINSNQTQKNNASNGNDNSTFAQRYDYVSRIQNTILFDHQALIPQNQNNPTKIKKPQNQFKKKQSNQQSVLPKSKQQQVRPTLKPQTNKLFSAGSQPSGHKIPQNKQLSNNTGNNATTNLQYSTSRENNQTYSRWIPKQLDDLDSSNIRYKFQQNDLSNIQESKNMQQLINEIDKIQKQWYQQRVLNRNNRGIHNVLQKKVVSNQRDKLKEDHNFDQDDKNNLMGLELKNFKVKLNQQNFYKKLFQSLKTKHNNHLRSIQKGKHSEEVPKNYVVYLIAHEVDETDFKSDDPQNSGKVEIKIPSSDIDKLIQLEQLQRQNNPLSPSIKPNQVHVSMSQTLEKKIIKSFQKQLRSKTMKIQILKQSKTDEEKSQNSKKKRTRMLEIALSEEYENSNIQSQRDKTPAKNKINLIGMYPLPVFSEGQKDKQNSFYQNLSMEALEINMYNCQTGNQEGKICFDLRKAKQDKQIQTLQSLEDITENSNPQSNPSELRFDSENAISERPSNNQLLKENHVDRGTSMKRQNRILKDSQRLSGKDNYLGKKDQTLQKEQIRAMKNKSRISGVDSFKSQIIPPLNQFKQYETAKNQNRSQRFISQRQSQKIFSPFEPKDEFPIKKVKTQMKMPAFGEEKELSQVKNLSRSRAAKQLDLIGKILKNPTMNMNLDIKRQGKQEQLDMNKKSEHELSELGSKGMLPLKIQKNDQHEKQVQPQKNYQQSSNNFDQKQQSYRLMKQQLMQTSNMIEVLKMKAQQFISKVEKEKKKPDLQYINSEIQFKYQGQKILPTQSLLYQNNLLAKKMISLDVRSSVINQTVLSKKKVSRNESNKPIEDLQTIQKNDIKKKISRNSQQRRTQQQQQREPRSMSKNSQLKNKQLSSADQMKQSSTSPKKKHKNSSLIYKEQKQYQFTQEQVDYQENYRNPKSRRKIKTDFDVRDSYHPKSKRKVFGADIDEDQSHQSIQQQKDPKNKMKARHQYNPIYRQNMSSPLSKNHSRSPDKNKSVLSYLREEQYIQVRLLQFRIKLLSVNHLKKITTKNSSETDPNFSYFVLVYSDTISQNDLSSNFPCVQKCALRSQSSDNDYSVSFSKVKHGQSLKGTNQDYLSLKGLQANKIYIQLYQSQTQQGFYRQFKSSALSGYQTEEINLITLSPQNKKALLSQKGPLASITVSFLELFAQRQSHQRNTDLHHRNITPEQEQQIVHYTNFLLNKQKIVGKININYNIDFVNRIQSHENNDAIYTHNSIRKKQTSQIEVIQLKNRQKYHDVHHKQSQRNFKNQLPKKNLENLRKLRGSQPPLYRYEKSQQAVKLRSQSGMTKKPSHKKKKFQRKMMETGQTEEVNRNHNFGQKEVDPLSILKRRVPKPLRRQSQSQKSRSQIFAMRIGKAYQTPLNKGKSLYESLNSSGSVPIRNKFKNSNEKNENDQKFELSQLQEPQVVLQNHLNSNSNEFNEKSSYNNMSKISKQRQSDVFQLRQKKQQKRMQKLKPYKLNSRILSQQSPQTRLGQNKKYDGGGNIKFGKSSRFIPTQEGTGQSSKSRQLKNLVPGPGYYGVKSIFDRHSIKEP